MVKDNVKLERKCVGEQRKLKENLKTMKLRFSNKISQPILTGDEIKAEDNTCIEISLLDSSTGNIVDVGPLASASVEIVALGQGTDDSTVEGFNEKIVRVEGKLPLLTVKMCKLGGGVGVLKNVKFRHHATDVKPSEFRLGARIVEEFDGVIVKEAKTESFVVKSYRNKYSKKNEIPSLWDKIWVLKNIQRRGKIDERLQAKGIDNIEKFLIQLRKNYQELKNIVGLRGKKWEATVNHVRKCQSDRTYRYINSEENSGVVFDIFGKLQALYSEGRYAATDPLSENKKVDADRLLKSAFEDWENVISVDGPNSLQQHLSAMEEAYFNLSNSCIPGHPVTDPNIGAFEMMDESDNIEASEMMDESDNIEAQDPFIVPDTTSFARCYSFVIHDADHMYGFPSGLDQHPDLDLGTMSFGSDFEHSFGVQQQNFIDEVHTDELWEITSDQNIVPRFNEP